MPKIAAINCHKVLNSRGNWTIETHVKLDDGAAGSQSIPGGASKGENEAISLPVDKAVEVVTTVINDALIDEDPFNQQKIDSTMIEMDGTANKKCLGGNSMLSVSMATAKACANSRGWQLWEYLSFIFSGQKKNKVDLKYPAPLFNILNGGKHAHNNLSFQEFVVIPAQGTPITQALEMGTTIYHILQKKLEAEGFDVDVGDEGGFAPNGLTVEKALLFIRGAASQQYKIGSQVFLGMDVAAESFYSQGSYAIKEENFKGSNLKLINYYEKLLKKFELMYVEDPFYEKDLEGWKQFMSKFGSKLLVVGDDLVVTNKSILQSVITDNLINAVIVKPNQIGTLTETFDFIKLAKSAKMATIISHRSGDTAEDTFIADLALATDAEFLKAGAPVRGERVAKYNRLLEILEG